MRFVASNHDLAALWTGNGGYLRKSVEVHPSDDAWLLRHSIWELSIPARAIESDHSLKTFLQRRGSARNLEPLDEGGRSLIRLLAAQGCTTIDGLRSSYSLDEVRSIVHGLISQWYGVYFSHPFWIKLRDRQLSLPQVFAWVLRTYHLSKSAGPTAARGALFSPNALVRNIFLKSALEEYSHCEIYYKPIHARFGLESRWVTSLLPTPSGLAFDQQMSVIAEQDWVAHAISAYFQEYTAAFRENAFALYSQLEDEYGLDGFFRGWKDHIGYDVDQTHADDFLDLFRGTDRVDQSHLLRSIDAALATVEFLIGSLDELIAVEPNMLIAAYRVSPVLVSEGATRTTTFGGVTLVRTLIESQGQEALADALARFIKMSFPEPPWITTDCLTKEFLSECAKRALSVAIEHEEIVLVGRFLELVNSSSATTQSELAISAPCLAIRNFIQESTRSPSAFLFLVRLLNLLGWVEEWPSGISLQPHDRFDPIRLTTLGVQFTELCKSATTSWHTLGRQDLLIADQNNQSNRT